MDADSLINRLGQFTAARLKSMSASLQKLNLDLQIRGIMLSVAFRSTAEGEMSGNWTSLGAT